MRRGLGRQSPDTDFSEGAVLRGAVHGATSYSIHTYAMLTRCQAKGPKHFTNTFYMS